MKRLIVLSSLALSLTAFGEWKKVSTVQIADTDALVQGIAKLGEFTGNQMLGIMASQSVPSIPWIKLMGMGRPGVATCLFAFGEEDADELEGAILYPVAKTKAEFMELHPDVREENGILVVTNEVPFNKACYYVKFSKGGQWAALSDKPQALDLALRETKRAAQKLDGDLIKISVPPSGMETIQTFAQKKKLFRNETFLAMLTNFSAVAVGLRVTDRGLDIRGAVKPVKGSQYERVGKVAITDDAWGTLDAKAVAFVLAAQDSERALVFFETYRKILEKYGIKTDSVAIQEVKKNYTTLTIDAPALVTYLKSVTNELQQIDKDALCKDFAAVGNKAMYALTGPASGTSIVLKGFTPVQAPKARFEATLPEAKEHPCSSVSFASMYSIYKALAPIMLNEEDDPQAKAMMSAMLASLPSEGPGGIASAVWFNRGAQRFIVRIGADEFKSISAIFAASMAMNMQKMQNAPMPTPSSVK